MPSRRNLWRPSPTAALIVSTAVALLVNLATDTIKVEGRWWPLVVWSATAVLVVLAVAIERARYAEAQRSQVLPTGTPPAPDGRSGDRPGPGRSTWVGRDASGIISGDNSTNVQMGGGGDRQTIAVMTTFAMVVIVALVVTLALVASSRGGRPDETSARPTSGSSGGGASTVVDPIGDSATNPGPIATTAARADEAARATITDPTPQTLVGACKRVSGKSSNLPSDTTLVTGKHKPGGDWYIELPTGWQTPEELSSWTDTQYFENATGESFTVGVYLAPLADVRAAKNNPKYAKSWSVHVLPASWRELASVPVNVSRTATSDC